MLGGTLSAPIIREAESDDLDVIASLARQSNPAPVAAYMIKRMENAVVRFVANVDAELIGFAGLDYSFYGNGFIPMLFVVPTARRSGVGTLLVRSAVRGCTTSKLFTSTNQSNVPMRALLEREGFELSGTISNLDEGDPEVVYFRRIGAGAN